MNAKVSGGNVVVPLVSTRVACKKKNEVFYVTLLHFTCCRAARAVGSVCHRASRWASFAKLGVGRTQGQCRLVSAASRSLGYGTDSCRRSSLASHRNSSSPVGWPSCLHP